jgi:hypothetical protein
MSGVFSIAAHSVLQYLPDVVRHKQTGWAHFSAFAEAISFLLGSDQERTIQALTVATSREYFCTENEHTAKLVACSRRWKSVGSSRHRTPATTVVGAIRVNCVGEPQRHQGASKSHFETHRWK